MTRDYLALPTEVIKEVIATADRDMLSAIKIQLSLRLTTLLDAVKDMNNPSDAERTAITKATQLKAELSPLIMNRSIELRTIEANQ